MEAAHAFMESIRQYPVAECGEPLVSLRNVVESDGPSVQFSETRLGGSFERLFFLREGLITAFVGLAGEMNARGWTLKVEDGYRSRAMQTRLSLEESVVDKVLRKVIWETGDESPDPALVFRRLTVLTATAPKIGTHMSGSAIDISVLRTGDLTEVDRGGPYLEMSELTPMASPFVSEEAARNRAEITSLMARHGFVAYPYEFWHCSKDDAYTEFLADSGRPARYGAVDFDQESGRVTPIHDPAASLHSNADVKMAVERALARLQEETDS